MSPNHPLLRRFEKRLQVEGRNLEWTTFKNDFFCRPRGAKVEIIWCARDWAREARQYPMPRLKRKLARLVENRLLWRYWPLAENRDLYFRSRYCVVDLGRGHEVRINLEERFHSPNRLLTSTQDLQTIVDGLDDKIDRVWSALHQWKNDEVWEKGWSSVQLPAGTREQLSKLVRAIGTLLRQPDDEFHWQYSIRPDFSEPVYLHPLKVPYSEPLLGEENYQPFLSHLKTHFPVESNILSVFDQYGWEMENLWPVIDMGSTMPTQHEKLEALLTWRDFLRGKVPADEIDELLRPFQ